VVGSLSVVASVLAAGPAAAVGEGESQVAVELGTGWLSADGRIPWGAVVAVEGRRGLNDAWALTLRGQASRHGVDADQMAKLPGGAVQGYGALAGLTYTLDNLRLVPYVEVLLGYLVVGGDVTAHRHQLGAQAIAGGEYLIDRRTSFGFAAAYMYAPFDLVNHAQQLGGNPYFFSLTARVGWSF
jgi:hypothetical protein